MRVESLYYKLFQLSGGNGHVGDYQSQVRNISSDDLIDLGSEG